MSPANAAAAARSEAGRGARAWWAVAGALLAAHLGLRAWAAYGAFFYLDDYRLVIEGGDRSLGERLLEPYDAQFMPFGRLLAWLAARADPVGYPVLATMSLAMAAAAAAACLWMLLTLFGRRPAVLALLALYLTTAVTLPAYLWWAAGLNQLPLQTVFFLAVGAWVRHLRGEGRRWAALTALVLAVGLCCYVKTLLVPGVLVFVTLACFTEGGPVRRVVAAVRAHPVALGAGLLGGGGYLTYYLATAPQIATVRRPGVAGDLAREMVGTSLASGLLGGPWRWDETIAPVAQADPPPAAVVLSWTVLAGVVLATALTRRRTLRAWAGLVAYVGADYLLLLTTRAQVVGAVSGTEYRYLTDAACMSVLALGLACLDLRGAVEPSVSRNAGAAVTTGRGRALRVIAVGAVLAVCASGVWSGTAYAQVWHQRHPGRAYLASAASDVDRLAAGTGGTLDLVDQVLPQRVTGALSVRDGSSRRLLGVLTDRARFPTATEAPHLIDARGRVVPADVDTAATTGPGPLAGCGWLVRSGASQRLPLDRPTIDRGWWLRIDYLAGADSALTVRTGDVERILDLRRGLHRVFVSVTAGFDTVELAGTDPGVDVCVDRVEVGLMEPAREQEEGTAP